MVEYILLKSLRFDTCLRAKSFCSNVISLDTWWFHFLQANTAYKTFARGFLDEVLIFFSILRMHSYSKCRSIFFNPCGVKIVTGVLFENRGAPLSRCVTIIHFRPRPVTTYKHTLSSQTPLSAELIVSTIILFLFSSSRTRVECPVSVDPLHNGVPDGSV